MKELNEDRKDHLHLLHPRPGHPEVRHGVVKIKDGLMAN